MRLAEQLDAIERRRGSRLVVVAASNLELELLPALYDVLAEIGRSDRLDVLFYCRGGMVTAARRVGLMLNDFAGRLGFIVPHHCESAGTITALAAREIIAGPVALFSPIDPLLQAAPGPGEGPHAVSAQDVRLFGQMSRDWFGMPEAEANQAALSAICESIFPTTLTSFYRSNLEVKAICEELLSLHMPSDEAARTRITEQLLHGWHSHSFALTGADLAALGLPVTRDPEVEAAAWKIAGVLRASIGVRLAGDDRTDAVVASRAGALVRRRSPGSPETRWEAGDIE